jgi:hypothetical protein
MSEPPVLPSLDDQLAALASTDILPLLRKAARASPTAAGVVSKAYMALFSLDDVEARYHGWLAAQMRTLLVEAADDALASPPADEEDELVGVTRGAAAVRRLLRPVTSRWRWWGRSMRSCSPAPSSSLTRCRRCG